MLERFLRTYVKMSVTHHKLIILLGLAVIIASGWIAAGLTVDSDVENMIPADHPTIQTYKNVDEEFDGQDRIMIVVSGEAEKAEPFVEALADRLVQEDLVTSVLYRIDPDFINENGMLYLPTKMYERLDRELADSKSQLSHFLKEPGINKFSGLLLNRMSVLPEEKRNELFADFVSVLTGSAEEDGVDTELFFVRTVLGDVLPEGSSNTALGNGFITSDDGVYLMMLKPKIKLLDQFVREEFFSGLQQVIDDELALPSSAGLEAGYTGGQVVKDYESDKVAFEGFLSTAAITFALILLVVMISFRRLGVPLASGIPLLAGTLLTSAFTVLVYGSINLFSLSFAVLLLGLGIDFAIHILARYQEERARGMALDEALFLTLRNTGSGMITGALTTAVAFAAFYFADFSALKQMGIISAVGILLALLSMFALMPSLIAWADKGKGHNIGNVPYYFLGKVSRTLQKYRVAALLGLLIILLLTYNTVIHTELKGDFTSAYPENLPSEKWLQIVEESFAYQADTLFLVANDLDELKTYTAKLQSLPSVANVSSVLDYLPGEQDYKLEVLRRYYAMQAEGKKQPQATQAVAGANADMAARALAEHLVYFLDESTTLGVSHEAGLAKLTDFISSLRSPQGGTVVGILFKSLGELLAQDNPVAPPSAVTISALPSTVKTGLVGQTGKYLIEVFPKGNIWDERVLAKLQQEIMEIIPAQVSGMPYLVSVMVQMIKDDVLRVSLIAAAIIFGLLFFSFRSVKEALLAMIPVSLTMYLVVGLRNVFQFDLNIFNLMALPLIIGIGVDNGVHITHRIKQEGIGSIPEVLIHTGKAVTMTTLTTVIGFGSLMFANHPGLNGIGRTIVLGMSLCLLLTICYLPILYTMVHRQNTVKKQENSTI